jgi:hypothetical protein
MRVVIYDSSSAQTNYFFHRDLLSFVIFALSVFFALQDFAVESASAVPTAEGRYVFEVIY